MTFYSVLGGYCIYYMIINVVGLFSDMPDSSSFGALLTNPWAGIGCLLLFMVICFVSGGYEQEQLSKALAVDLDARRGP